MGPRRLHPRRLLGAALAIGWLMPHALWPIAQAATVPAIEPFGPKTLNTWRSTVQRPTWVVFTATWCGVCPSVVADLTRTARQHPAQPRVWAVVINRAPGEDDASLLNEPHLRTADQVWAFDGVAQRIRHSVNPQWRGEVPYVGLMNPGGSVRWYTGMPPPRDLQLHTRAAPTGAQPAR